MARTWLARGLIGLVFAWNVQCALAFLGDPATYAASFELTGAPGSAAVRGVGLLFLMWNVPYAVALWHPLHQRVALHEAFAMQAIGLVGEGWIRLTLPETHAAARALIARFVLFDGAGLLLLLIALLLTRAVTTRHAPA